MDLKQISIIGLIKKLMPIYYSKKKSYSIKEQEKIASYEALIKYNVTNYGDLKDLIKSGILEFQTDYLENALQEAEIALMTASGNAKTYENSFYIDSEIDEETLLQTDIETKADVLLLSDIFRTNGNQISTLRYYSINFLKEMLKNYSISSFGKIENSYISNIRSFGNISVNRLNSAIEFYEQQVIRQAELYPWCKKVDVFSLDKEYREEATEEQIDETARYLIDNATECVWGNLNSKQKRLLEKIIKGYMTSNVMAAKQNLIDTISNYSTLSELETGLVRSRTIDRFIKKY